jgi:hypothetical protein
MATRRVLTAAALALLVGLVVAPAAEASSQVKASVRVEAAGFQIAPPTRVVVPQTGTVTDSLGAAYPYTTANALAALGEAADLRGFSYETLTFGGEPYVNTILGETSWMYAVNGAGYPNIDVGAFSFEVLPGDAVVYYQSPTFTPDTMLMKVRVSPTGGLVPGQAATFTVVGDALSAPNSAADATRFGVDPATVVAPSAFPVVTGATLHVGSRVYVDGAGGDALDGMVTVSDLPKGTYGVWAEKATDSDFTYVRSLRSTVNVALRPVLSRVVARPNPFVRGVDKVRVTFTLSKAATVRLVVRSRAGALIKTVTATRSTGVGSIVWNGRTSTGRLVRSGVYSLRLKAADSWGRVSKVVTTSVTAR